MNSDANPILTLAWTFGVMSLFAVGGANAAIPEMHRLAVDVQHWMTDSQFADVFAISQLSPGPNVLIVTLIGYSVAGVAGALVATLAMCGPTAILAYYVSRRPAHRQGCNQRACNAGDGIADQGHNQHIRPRRQLRYREHVGELLVGHPVLNIDRNAMHFGNGGIGAPHREQRHHPESPGERQNWVGV